MTISLILKMSSLKLKEICLQSEQNLGLKLQRHKASKLQSYHTVDSMKQS